MIINDAPLEISFFDQNLSFSKKSRNVELPLEITMSLKQKEKSPNLKQRVDYQLANPSTLNPMSLSKIETANTPDIDFKQTANFFFPQFERQQSQEYVKESQLDKIQKGRGVSVFAFSNENEFNLDLLQQSAFGQENDSQKKKIRTSKILINSQVNEQQDKQHLPKMLKRSHISMSQPKLHNQGGQAVSHNLEKESNPENSKDFTTNLVRNESSKKLSQDNKEKRIIPNRQHILSIQQKEQNSLINLSNSVQKYPNSNNNVNFANQNKDLNQQDLRLNNFLQLFNEKQSNSVKNSNLQLINIQPKSTSNISSVSKALPFGKQGFLQQSKEQNSIIHQKPNLKLLDDHFAGESNQIIKDITPQSCQSKLGQDFSDKIKQGPLNQILSFQMQSKLNNNFSSNISQFTPSQINQAFQEKDKQQYSINQSQLSQQQNYQQQNKFENIQQINQQTLGINKQQQVNSYKQKQRKGSAACLDEIQKNLLDDCFIQSLKKQQIHLMKIRQQQLKNFEDLNSSPIVNESNYENIINNKGSIPMRQDIKGQVLYSSQQDSRRNQNNNNNYPQQFHNNINLYDQRVHQAKSNDNKKIKGFESASDDSHYRSNFNFVNSLKKGKLSQHNQFDEFYGNIPSNQINQKFNINLHNTQASNEDESDDNIKIDGDIKRLRNKNLLHRRSVATIHTSNPISIPVNKFNSISKEQQQTEDQVISEMEKVRRQIKQTINKGIRNDSKNITSGLPQLNNNQNTFSLQLNQQKRIDLINNNFNIHKKSYQFLNVVNPDLLSKIQSIHNAEDFTPTGRESQGTDTNFSQIHKNNQGRTFLQRKPQENIVNKIFQVQNEVIVE